MPEFQNLVPTGKPADTSSQNNSKSERITAKTTALNLNKIEQCDVFKDVLLIESVQANGDTVNVTQVHYPMAMCLNQSCDLESDLRDRIAAKDSDKYILQLIMLPVFNAIKLKHGAHWGQMVKSATSFGREKWKDVCNNEVPRYHFLNFSEAECQTPLVIDFKHFFTVSRDYLYGNLNNRLFAMAPLYRESIATRFANYLARIGLP